jgi:CspA family cold shock protein
VLHPYSARAVFEVKRAREAERYVFALLSEYRIRADREFFQIPFSKAVQLIDEELLSKSVLERKQGHLKWFNKRRGYGVLKYEQTEEIFVHISDFIGDNVGTPEPGQRVEFDIMTTSKGSKAIRVVLTEDRSVQRIELTETHAFTTNPTL